MIRAKFKVVSITETEGGLRSVKLQPVTSGSPENELFYKWTPSGEINLSTINTNVAKEFIPGLEFYVDFTQVALS